VSDYSQRGVNVEAWPHAGGSAGEPQPEGSGDHSEIPSSEQLKKADVNPAEQGQTANIRQNTTNKGFFKGRRIK
jgi:hypothetical protein